MSKMRFNLLVGIVVALAAGTTAQARVVNFQSGMMTAPTESTSVPVGLVSPEVAAAILARMSGGDVVSGPKKDLGSGWPDGVPPPESQSALPPSTDGGVPEPATWAMMIAGFSGAGVAMRRRRAVRA